jgi:hypothetical protein
MSAASRVDRARVVSATIGRRGLASAARATSLAIDGKAPAVLPGAPKVSPRAPEVSARTIRRAGLIAGGIADTGNGSDASRSMRAGRVRIGSAERREGEASAPVDRASRLRSSSRGARAEAMGSFGTYGSD